MTKVLNWLTALALAGPVVVLTAPPAQASCGYVKVAPMESTEADQAVGCENEYVMFPGTLATGIPLVNAIGPSDHYCKAREWFPANNGTLVRVFCFDRTGKRVVSSPYRVAYTRQDGQRSGAYLRSDNNTGFNGAGGVNTVTSAATGVYLVSMTGVGQAGGHVQVATIGADNRWCKTSGWSNTGTTELIHVRCFTAAGNPADSTFVVVFAAGTNILLDPTTTIAGYAWANLPSTNGYTPSAAYAYATHAGPMWIGSPVVGKYWVHMPFDVEPGGAFVTAYGTDNARCKAVSHLTAEGIHVACHNPAGAAVDAQYAVAYL